MASAVLGPAMPSGVPTSKPSWPSAFCTVATTSRVAIGLAGIEARRPGADRGEVGGEVDRRRLPSCRRSSVRRRHRLGVERLGDIVARLGGIGIAAAGGQREPLVRLLEVSADAEAAGIEHAQVELAVGHAAVGGLLEPLGGGFELLLAQLAAGIERGEVVHRHAVAGFGGALVPELGLSRSFSTPLPFS